MEGKTCPQTHNHHLEIREREQVVSTSNFSEITSIPTQRIQNGVDIAAADLYSGRRAIPFLLLMADLRHLLCLAFGPWYGST